MRERLQIETKRLMNVNKIENTVYLYILNKNNIEELKELRITILSHLKRYFFLYSVNFFSYRVNFSYNTLYSKKVDCKANKSSFLALFINTEEIYSIISTTKGLIL